MILVIPIIFFILCALAWLAYTQSYFINYCKQTIPPSDIVIKTNLGDFIISQDYSTEELTSLFNKETDEAARGTVLGWAKTDIAYTVTADYNLKRLINQSCATPQITVEVEFNQPEIQIASDLAPESCEYLAVLDHEGLHVAVYREYSELMATSISTYLTNKYPIDFHFINKTPDEIQVEFSKILSSSLPELVAPIMAAASSAQAALDTDEEYAKIAARCN